MITNKPKVFGTVERRRIAAKFAPGYEPLKDFMGYSVKINREEKEILIVPNENVSICCKNCNCFLEDIGIMHKKKYTAGYKKIVDMQAKTITYRQHPTIIDFYCIHCRKQIDLSNQLNSVCIVRFDFDEPTDLNSFPIFNFDDWNDCKPAMSNNGPMGHIPQTIDIRDIKPNDEDNCKWAGILCPEGLAYHEKSKLDWEKREQELIGEDISPEEKLGDIFSHGPRLSIEECGEYLDNIQKSFPVLEYEQKKEKMLEHKIDK